MSKKKLFEAELKPTLGIVDILHLLYEKSQQTWKTVNDILVT